ncbi:MAG: methylmalonyl Co-A mutase-associated GTPase MeaB [Lewinella sp.]|nr:methylmalonyl Co-A mutase-associated GTPase MeaB [Lewinella sp.]
MSRKKANEPPAGDPASPINPDLQRRRTGRLSPEAYAEGVLAGDRVLLSKAITLIESTLAADQALAGRVVDLCLPHRVPSRRIGISGAPGAGKSTFIEALGKVILSDGGNLAVLTIDPSSRITGGSILGDKTRMETLSLDERAFIRPSPAGDTLGGVARKTRETILLCEAAGYSDIIVETVGVGQSETTVQSMVDCFLLLLLPGAGDELQGIKRGIVEVADLVAVNKADGDGLTFARKAQAAYRNALHLFPPKISGWTPEVLTCSALNNTGIGAIWQVITTFFDTVQTSGFMAENRREQTRFWFHDALDAGLRNLVKIHPKARERLPALEKEVLEGTRSPLGAAEEILGILGGGDLRI